MKLVNKEDLAVGDMKGELLERRPLPIGRTQFMEWSNRIIKAAAVEADTESLRFSLASMVMHMGPTECFREDAYFAMQLRMGAAKQTAHMMATEIKEEQLKKQAEATAPTLIGVDNGAVLETH